MASGMEWTEEDERQGAVPLPSEAEARWPVFQTYRLGHNFDTDLAASRIALPSRAPCTFSRCTSHLSCSSGSPLPFASPPTPGTCFSPAR